ncbi:hypothetical protein ABT56_19145 [Photobacterium aquae]|uniref:Uncharacterized protein n=1 Tax=Photobacterium aquae TaxID=1195763 RepID=A0A0J1GUY2_9GAMM|nr:conjugative transfer protein MobI(A/C) [Photobacterium aquae]KLV03545.1 hypothetical protein ABT56_19145 [Photobacterium aquae]
MTNTKITQVQNQLYSMIDDEYEKALFAQSLWMSEVAKREVQRSQMKMKGSEKTWYELRVNFSRYTFSVRWYRISFQQHGDKAVRLSIGIALPTTKKGYSRKNFPIASEWEQDLIMQCEEILQPIRNNVKTLGLMHKNLTQLAKDNSVDFSFTPIKDRVQMQSDSIQKFKSRL